MRCFKRLQRCTNTIKKNCNTRYEDYCHRLEKPAENQAMLYIQMYLIVTEGHCCASDTRAITEQTIFQKQLQIHTCLREEILDYSIQQLLYISVLLTVLIPTWYFLPSWMIKRKELIRRKPTKLKCVRSVLFFFLVQFFSIVSFPASST